jgi:Lysozyme like domain
MNTGPMVALADQAVVCDTHCEHLKHVEHLSHVLRIQRAVRVVVQLTARPVTSVSRLIWSCTQLEVLWTSEGGRKNEAFIAAEIAKAESGGNALAVSPGDDVGLWQINRPSWGRMASTDPVVNVRSAITISDNGANWSPWTTYVDGAYIGRC